MLKSYKIYKTNEKEMIWTLPPALAKKLNLKENQFVELCCGSLSVQLKVLIAQSSIKTVETIGLSEDALIALRIPAALSLCIKPISPGHFRLGPVIGILTFPHVIVRNQLNRYLGLAKRMKDIGLLYVFRPKDINSEAKIITGFYYDKTKKAWVSREFPFPDAVRDRIYPNNYKAHHKLEKVIGQNRIFNKKNLINKMEFNVVLNNDPFLRNFIPEAKLFRGVYDLEHFLAKYGGVFLKPLDSMRGRGIINVISEGNDLTCHYMDAGSPTVKKISRADDISEILGRVNKNKRPYVIQAAVNRMNYMERPFSIRIMTAKDGTGNWSVPAIIAKAARPGSFLTNISSGAEYILLKDLLNWIRQQLQDTKIDFRDLLTDLCLRTSAALDNEFGPLGKLGIDAVIDTSGKPWLIEANGNPGLIFREGQREIPAWDTQDLEFTIAYAIYLAGFLNSESLT